ncbi:MAG: carbon-nitrogen hydrolase family protein [Spirochaetales bacterium]|nr:carbon-nitrogen hydrolase family protein [Spirochaetales bacterium]
MKSFILALCQNRPSYDIQQNLKRVFEMLNKAARKGAELIVLPEIFYYPYEIEKLRDQTDKDNQILNLLCEWAGTNKKYLCTGSFVEKRSDALYNTAYLIDPEGTIILKYSKSHLFDVELPNLKVQESAVFTKGDTIDVADCELGKIGILICYDIRFPEMARLLGRRGAEIILVPAAFNTVTGPAHWKITFRSRAVENQCFVAAVSPARNRRSSYRAYGHSLIIDPWGRALAEAGTGEEIVFARLDPKVLIDTRVKLPLLRHRRDDLYKLTDKP